MDRERDHPSVHKAKNSVRIRVTIAVRDGKLLRPDHCSKCSKPCKPQAHHADYNKPLEVTWLCRRCHYQEHVDSRAGHVPIVNPRVELKPTEPDAPSFNDDYGPLLTTEQAAQLLDRSIGTLENWRSMKKGPRWIKFYSTVRYPKSWLAEWVEGVRRA